MIEKLLLSLLTLILTYLTWVWGGIKLYWLPPAIWASLVLLVILLGSSFSTAHSFGRKSRQCWWRDPFFYFGLLFLGYLAIQWWNAGRTLYYDVGFGKWRYSLPHHADWPSAFSREEAAQMLGWFFPAWVLGLTVRSPLISRRALGYTLQGLVYSSGLLALFGVVQFLSLTHEQYWCASTSEGFFASFGYTNHAAAYFVLMGAVTAGLLYREIFRTHIQAKATTVTRAAKLTALTTTLLLCLVGANFSLSRAGIILAWTLAIFIAAYGFIRGWKNLHPAGRVNLAAAIFAIACIFFFVVAGFGEKQIQHEFEVRKPIHHELFSGLDGINLDLADRPLLDQVAWKMWRDNPAFGVGGWGFRYLLAFYLAPEEWHHVLISGKANVHCDILQFLAEFGVVGFGLMTAAVGTLIVGLFRKTNISSPIWVMGVTGLTLVIGMSLIDLPFRCPAILCTWIVILSALPKMTNQNTKVDSLPLNPVKIS